MSKSLARRRPMVAGLLPLALVTLLTLLPLPPPGPFPRRVRRPGRRDARRPADSAARARGVPRVLHTPSKIAGHDSTGPDCRESGGAPRARRCPTGVPTAWGGGDRQ